MPGDAAASDIAGNMDLTTVVTAVVRLSGSMGKKVDDGAGG